MAGDVQAFVKAEGGWIRFENPVAILETTHAAAVNGLLGEVERQTRRLGCHAVGFMSYEAASAYGLAVHTPPQGLPLLWFGLFPAGSMSSHAPGAGGAYTLTRPRPTVHRAQFIDTVGDIKRHLAAGDTYQANYTFQLEAEFDGDPEALFADLVSAQQGGYAVYLRCGRFTVCSASPELFFERAGDRLTTRPMKGTARRGRTPPEDEACRDRLRNSAKQQAENVMIVDMIRNDLGRVARTGTVRVDDLFTLERYPNVWQMTSTVTASSNAPLADVFAAMHPSASVTGAPKVRTMELLRGWESGPRGVYTGAVGHVMPDGRARFNVAIRTAVVDHDLKRVRFGVGSGVVWDSDADEEYDECLAKASVFGTRPVDFELLETLRWSGEEGFVLLDRHLERLRMSADYFGFAYNETGTRRALEAVVRGQAGPLRLRLLLTKAGTARVEAAAFQRSPVPVRVGLARHPVVADNVFLYHKTTHREVYEGARLPEYDETLLWNSRREITEAITANVIVELDGRLLTPPVSCGLLAGTFRAELLARGEIAEAVITLDSLHAATRVWLVNSVQEWRAAEICENVEPVNMVITR